ncbi:MAG: prepilin-type N-terminal cleavage/methylation domain-containing protein [Thermoguttaceae bacterium]|nr:prepilin-type N-terminal cleavage/methylation domain-containing protein [Thermoguttaceae bacterium]MDW8038331.1 prepilin-type N-terminal cleavage/methylation domain-containing protein [Thermoguttaceae bacterium]
MGPGRKIAPSIINRKTYSGLTLLEVLISLVVLVLVVGALMGLSRAVAIGSAYSDSVGLTSQHARVVLDRITRTVRQARANVNFPGFLVVADQIGAWRFPDCLVVWSPDSEPADPEGMPRFSELVIYCPHPQQPNWLMEIRLPEDHRAVPPVTDLAGWQTAVASIKASAAGTAVRLTDRLRTCKLSDFGAQERAALRFEARYRPSLEEQAAYKAGTLTWPELSWPQSIYGPTMGLRQAWLRIEFQLVGGQENGQQVYYPFFGSSALYYPLAKSL